MTTRTKTSSKPLQLHVPAVPVDRTRLARALASIRRCSHRSRFDEVLAQAQSLAREGRSTAWRPAHRVAVSRLAARCALALDDFERAVQWSQTGLEIRPDDATLLMVASQCEMRGDHRLAALCLAEKAVQTGPQRADVMEHAARTRAAIGDGSGALEALQRAVVIDPQSARRRIELASAALEWDRCDIGLRALEALCDPPPLLMARLLRGSGALRDAVDLYQTIVHTGAVRGPCSSISPNAQSSLSPHGALFGPGAICHATIELIDVLEELGESDQLQTLADQWLSEGNRGNARVGIRLSEAMLGIGSPGRCIRCARRAGRQTGESARAAMLIVVAGSVAGRGRLARLAMANVNAEDREFNARIWRRGAMAEIIRQQTSAQAAGADPTTSILEPMLKAAQETLGELVTQHPGYPDLRYHHAQVLAALGLTEVAQAEVGQAIASNPRYERALRLHETLRLAA